jgi:CBS-domain-containing membrane protein
MRADAQTQQRVEELTDRNTERLLTVDEPAEYEGLVTAADVIAILQAKARARIAADPPAA